MGERGRRKREWEEGDNDTSHDWRCCSSRVARLEYHWIGGGRGGGGRDEEEERVGGRRL
jgi:hypothetical protein